MTSPGRNELAATVTVRSACPSRLQPASRRRDRRDDDAARELVLLGEQLGGRRVGPQPLRPAGYRVDGHHARDQQRVDVAADDRRRRRADGQDRGQRIGELGPGRGQQPPQPDVPAPAAAPEWAVGQVVENASPCRRAGFDGQRPCAAGQPRVDDLRVQRMPGGQRLRGGIGLPQHLGWPRTLPRPKRWRAAALTGLSQRRRAQWVAWSAGSPVTSSSPASVVPPLARCTDDSLACRAAGKRRQDPHGGSQIGAGDDVRGPRCGRAGIVQRHADVGDGQCRQRVGRCEVAVQRGDQQHRSAIGPQFADQLQQRRAGRMTSRRRWRPDPRCRPRAAKPPGLRSGARSAAAGSRRGRPPSRLRRCPRVRRRPRGRRVRGPGRARPTVPAREPIAGAPRWPATRPGRARAPARRAAARRRPRRPGRRPSRVRLRAHATRRGASPRSAAPSMTTTFTRSRRRSAPGSRTSCPALASPRPSTAAKVCRPICAALRHPGQHRAGRVLGATAGQQRARGGDQRTVRGLVDVLLHRPGHRALRGVDGGVDRLRRPRRAKPRPPRRLPSCAAELATWPGRRDDGDHRSLRPVGRGQLRLPVAPPAPVRRRLGDLQASLGQVQQRRADRLGQPVGRRRRRAEREVGAHSAQPRFEH